LHHCNQPVETVAPDPSLIIDELAPDHGNLCDRTSERQQSETEEPQEQRCIAQLRGLRLRVMR
jgi:hypothetical protein